MPSSKEKHAEYLRNRYNNDPVYRKEHKRRVAENKKNNQEENRRLVGEFRKSGCLVCHETEICCLSAHHLDASVKEFNIAESVYTVTPTRLKKELAKCVCLCENCHRKVHAGIIILDLSRTK